MASDERNTGQPQPGEPSRKSPADPKSATGQPDPARQESANAGREADSTISRNTAPNTDDSVVEGMDESVPGSSTLDAHPSEPANPQPGESSHPGKAA
jgi:hypothetical protein